MSWLSERHQKVGQSWSEVPSECGCVVQECTEIHKPRCSIAEARKWAFLCVEALEWGTEGWSASLCMTGG
jgi:hypothetical protein